MYLVNLRILSDFIDLLPAVLRRSHAFIFVTLQEFGHSGVIHPFIIFYCQKSMCFCTQLLMIWVCCLLLINIYCSIRHCVCLYCDSVLILTWDYYSLSSYLFLISGKSSCKYIYDIYVCSVNKTQEIIYFINKV